MGAAQHKLQSKSSVDVLGLRSQSLKRESLFTYSSEGLKFMPGVWLCIANDASATSMAMAGRFCI